MHACVRACLYVCACVCLQCTDCQASVRVAMFESGKGVSGSPGGNAWVSA